MESMRRRPPTAQVAWWRRLGGGSATSTGIVGIARPGGLDPGKGRAHRYASAARGMIPMLHRYSLALATALNLALAALTAVPATAANLLELNFYLGGPRYEGVF